MEAAGVFSHLANILASTSDAEFMPSDADYNQFLQSSSVGHVHHLVFFKCCLVATGQHIID